jgi:hypothetical protein
MYYVLDIPDWIEKKRSSLMESLCFDYTVHYLHFVSPKIRQE